jgi:hypothetical protein
VRLTARVSRRWDHVQYVAELARRFKQLESEA